jgi:hypothetical protein
MEVIDLTAAEPIVVLPDNCEFSWSEGSADSVTCRAPMPNLS